MDCEGAERLVTSFANIHAEAGRKRNYFLAEESLPADVSAIYSAVWQYADCLKRQGRLTVSTFELLGDIAFNLSYVLAQHPEEVAWLNYKHLQRMLGECSEEDAQTVTHWMRRCLEKGKQYLADIEARRADYVQPPHS